MDFEKKKFAVAIILNHSPLYCIIQFNYTDFFYHH